MDDPAVSDQINKCAESRLTEAWFPVSGDLAYEGICASAMARADYDCIKDLATSD